jgi:hypothetical protein
MKRLLLASTLLAGLGCAPAFAQVPCIGVGGVNNINVPGVSCLQEPAVNSYAATSLGLASAASATDIACLSGAANIVVRVKQIRVSGSAATLVTVPVSILKRASLNTGGTPATGNALPVAYPLDSGFTAAKATPTAWTTNPTIVDTSPGILDTALSIFNLTSTAGNGSTTFTFDTDRLTSIVLRKATEAICVNFNSTTVSTPVENVEFRWSEASQ